MPTSTVPGVAAPARLSPITEQPRVLTLGDYLAAVASAVRAGMPARSWIEATVTAVKASSYGHGLSLVDPASGPSAPTMRALLRASDRAAIADRLGAALDPVHLVGVTVVVQIEPEFHPRWGMGGRITGLSAALRESLMRRALEEVRARLKAEKLYDRQRSLPTPADVVRVAVVHPAGAAGYADIAGELARWEKAGIAAITSVPAPFEGPRAVAEIVAALRRAASGGGVPPDAVLMVRGGGDRAGLLALDDEAVARAVCLCPVPVIVGLGHQVDSTLVDQVTAVSCHTPSKALAHLAALIAGPARRARADMAAVIAEADRRSTTALHGLDAVRHGVMAGTERRLHAAASTLATLRTDVEAGAAAAGERYMRLGAEADALLQTVLERAPARLDMAERLARRLAGDAMADARRRLEQADDGRALIGTVLSRVGARLDAAALDALRRHEALPLDAARRLTDAGLDLARLAGTVESLGLDSTLKRGFALATTADGTLVSTRAAALASKRLTLTFADGAVMACVGAILPTTRLLMHRYANRTQHLEPSLFETFDPDPTTPLKVTAGIHDAARLHLHHDFRRPLHFGIDDLCDASNENAEVFLQFSGALVARMETRAIRNQSPALSAAMQQAALLEKAKAIMDGWSFAYSARIRKLVDTIAKDCVDVSLAPNARLGPGANAIALPEPEMQRLLTDEDELAVLLKHALANGTIVVRRDYGQGGKSWCLIELSGTVCIAHGLTLKRGGFLEKRLTYLRQASQ